MSRSRPARLGVSVWLLFVLGANGCGYRPMLGSVPETERLAVVGMPPLVADAAVVAEVEAGVRTGLSELGALRSGSGFPRVAVELVRIDVLNEGVAAGRDPHPLARGTRIGVVARAWIERAPGAAPERDTGDMRAFELLAVQPTSRLETVGSDAAVRAAARRLGARLGRAVLGEPAAADENP